MSSPIEYSSPPQQPRNMNLTGASISEDILAPNDVRDIFLPNQTEHVSQIALDIGGSLAKVVYFTGSPGRTGGRLNFKKFETEHIDLCIDFIAVLVANARKQNAENDRPTGPQVIKATGGGAHLFYDRLCQRLPGVVIQKEDEMNCLITGLNFFITEIPYEVFTYTQTDPMGFEETPKNIYPYMALMFIKKKKLVNIGSGVSASRGSGSRDKDCCRLRRGMGSRVIRELWTRYLFLTTFDLVFISILKVTGPDQFERISGTSLGGGTLWGLLSLLTGAQTFDGTHMHILNTLYFIENEIGDNRNVDMLVGDIYGTDYSKIGLKSTTIASSFGKVFKRNVKCEQGAFKNEDISRSLLYMVSNNIGQIAYLNAEKHSLKRIYFGGCFIRGHPITMNTLSYAIHFWSKGQMKALFLRHEGHLGAVGAFLKHHPVKRFSFSENFTLSQKISGESRIATGVLERAPNRLTAFPLLDNLGAYHPDTFELIEPQSQRYWIDTLESGMDHLIDMAAQWESERAREDKDEGQEDTVLAPVVTASMRTADFVDEEDIRHRLEQFSNLFKSHLVRLRSSPTMYGSLTVRGLLNLREQCLRELGFPDIFSKVKRLENRAAFGRLRAVLDDIDAVEQDRLRVTLLIKNILAGNMFDWGSNQVLEMLRSGQLDFESAKIRVRIPTEPQFNSLNAFLDSVCEGPRRRTYTKVVIFVDNSGADIVLGVIPFARYFLAKGADVILAANSFPAVNDVTVSVSDGIVFSMLSIFLNGRPAAHHQPKQASELKSIMSSVAELDETIAKAWCENRLVVKATGSSSPCLDLRRIDDDLATACQDVDLVVLEGMGRAIHTNYHARFRCDALKIGVFKSPAAAKELGAQMYDGLVVFSSTESRPHMAE
ncbi:fumble-domain-containing protein [Jimgerdemannia flammicorona]|uniref:Fumble-domain-containing protein n=1 Tax=Jimgerdemannia flammicorona TaxID=994334 RepID=A0A433DLC0_9FUNG|nr:fumble-domain-containing protein [Jimgerdemannia flammicorona]